MSKKSKLNKAVADQLREALTCQGYKEPQLSELMAQAAHETAGFNSTNAINNNNFGGIKFQSTLKNITVPSTNFAVPKSEDPEKGRGVPYAHFNSIDDFAEKWVPLAHLSERKNGNNIGSPLQANTIADYVRRLKLNGYFQDREDIYLKGMQYWDKILKEEYNEDSVIARPAQGKFTNNVQDFTDRLQAFGNTGSFYSSKHKQKNKLNSIFFPKFTEEGIFKLQRADPVDTKKERSKSQKDSGSRIEINCNSPLIGNFTITTRDQTGERNTTQREVEKALLKILDSTQAL
jgi:hypothetical protein